MIDLLWFCLISKNQESVSFPVLYLSGKVEPVLGSYSTAQHSVTAQCATPQHRLRGVGARPGWLRGSGWVLERKIKNEQEVLAQFLRALRQRKPSGRGCAPCAKPAM